MKILRARRDQRRRRGDHLRQHPHAGSHLGRHQGAGQHQHLRPQQVRRAVRQVRRRQRAGLLAALDGHLRNRAAQGNRQGAGRPLRPGDRLARRRRRRSRQAASHLGRRSRSRATRCTFILDSDAQARGPINLRPCVSRNFIECLVKMIFIPDLPVNDGLSRPVRVSYPPEGSLLNPRFPAPVNMYVRPSQITTSVVMRALAQARARPRAGAGQRGRRLAVERRPPSRNRAAGIRNTRSSTAAPARVPTATASAPWTSWSSTS